MKVLVCCALAAALLAVTSPALADERVVFGELSPTAPIQEYRFKAKADDTVALMIETLVKDVKIEVGQGEGQDFVRLPGSEPAYSPVVKIPATGSYTVRVQPTPIKRRYRLLMRAYGGALEVSPVAHKLMTTGAQASPKLVLRGGMQQRAELKPDDAPDPEFAVPHQLLRVEGKPGEIVQLVFSSSAIDVGAIWSTALPKLRRASGGTLKGQEKVPSSGYMDVRVLALDGRSGPYEVQAVTTGYEAPTPPPAVAAVVPAPASSPSPPASVPTTVPTAKPLGSLAYKPYATAPIRSSAESSLPPANSSDPRASESGRFKGFIRSKACPNRQQWPIQGSEPYTFEQPASGIYHCGERCPDNAYAVFWAGHYYYWRERAGGSRALGDPTIGTSPSYGGSGVVCIGCKERHRACLRECGPQQWDRSQLCIGLCDRARDNCFSGAGGCR